MLVLAVLPVAGGSEVSPDFLSVAWGRTVSGAPDFKTGPRVRANRDGWEGIRSEKVGGGATCRGCHSTPANMRHAHHVVPRAQGGDDVDDNIVLLCWSCHDAYHRGDRRVASLIRESLTAEELRYVFEKKGFDWLDRRYPLERGSGTLPNSGGATFEGTAVSAAEAATRNLVLSPSEHTDDEFEPCPTCKGAGRRRKRREKPRRRRTYSIAVPVDEQENGLDVLRTLIEQAREVIGRPEGTPPYFVLVEALYLVTTSNLEVT